MRATLSNTTATMHARTLARHREWGYVVLPDRNSAGTAMSPCLRQGTTGGRAW